jgi:hypothetical protein
VKETPSKSSKTKDKCKLRRSSVVVGVEGGLTLSPKAQEEQCLSA